MSNDKPKGTPRQPDADTQHTTDPQEHMEGPISSIMQGIKHEAEDDDKKSRKDVEDERRKENDPYQPQKDRR